MQLVGVLSLSSVIHAIAHGPWGSASAVTEIGESAFELEVAARLGDALLASRTQGRSFDSDCSFGVDAAPQAS